VADTFSVDTNSGNLNPAFEFGKLIKEKVKKNMRTLTDSEKVDQMMNETEKRRSMRQ